MDSTYKIEWKKLDPCNYMDCLILTRSKLAGQAKTRLDQSKNVADVYVLYNFINVR